MHLPYLQITNEAWDYAQQLAGLTGVSIGDAFIALCDLWRWGLKMGPDNEPPQGVCASPLAVERMASTMRWHGDKQRLTDVLVDLGLIQLLPVGLRVRGMMRYWSAWKKNRPRDWSAWAERNPDLARSFAERSSDGERTGAVQLPPENRSVQKPQTQTQTQKETPTTTGGQAPKKSEPPPDPAPKPVAQQPADVGWFARAQERRLQRFPNALTEPPPPGFNAPWWAGFMRDVKNDVARADAAYDVFLEDDWAQKLKVPCPFAAFAKKYREYIPGQGMPAAPPGQAAWEPPDTPAGRRWARVIDAVRAEGKSYACKWLQELTPLMFTADVLTVAARDKYQLGWIETHYVELLQRVAEPLGFSVQLAAMREVAHG